MKRLARIAMFGACSAAVLLPASAAYAGGTVDRTHTNGEAVSIPFTNPCTGEVDQLDLVESGQHLLVVRGNGTFKTLDNTHGTFTLADGSTGRFVTSSDTTGGKNVVQTTVLMAKGSSPSGDPVELKFVSHFAVNGNGDVTVSFLKGC